MAAIVFAHIQFHPHRERSSKDVCPSGCGLFYLMQASVLKLKTALGLQGFSV